MEKLKPAASLKQSLIVIDTDISFKKHIIISKCG